MADRGVCRSGCQGYLYDPRRSGAAAPSPAGACERRRTRFAVLRPRPHHRETRGPGRDLRAARRSVASALGRIAAKLAPLIAAAALVAPSASAAAGGSRAAGASAAGAGHPGRRARNARRHAVPAHVPTWSFVDGCNAGGGAPAGTVRAWVSYAETNCGSQSRPALRACHTAGRRYCEVIQYLDTDWNFTTEATRLAGAASYAWWIHEPAPNRGVRVFSDTFGGGYLVNQTNPSVRSFFRSYAQAHFDADDGLLMDWQSPSLSQELYYSTCGCATTAEIRTDAALRAGHRQMSAAITHADGNPFIQVDNTLPPNPFLPQGLGMLDRRIGVDAWMIEGEPFNYGTLDPFYSTLLDQLAYIATRTRGFAVPMSRAEAGSAYLARARRIQEATIMLAFSPGHLVDWAALGQGSADLEVWPEEALYPTHPVQTMARPGGRGCLAGTGALCSRGGHNSLEVAPGVYRREFRACYDRGRAIGPCAALVNTSARAVTVRGRWLRLRLRHEVAFAGGDVQSGGALVLAGPRFRPSATRVPADDALLLSR
jgi:hypothetical protein